MKVTTYFFIIILLVGLTYVACTSPQQETLDLTQVRQAIEAGNLKFEEAFRQGDPTAVANLYTEDAVLLPPNSDMISGKMGIEAFWKTVMEMGVKDAVLTTVDVTGSGDMVCEIGKYKLTIQPEGQEAVEDIGKYVVIWKQAEDGTWNLHIDIWNTSLPAQ